MPVVASSSAPLSMQELAEIELEATKISNASNPKILRLIQELYRSREIAKKILIEREAAVQLGGEDPHSDSIWQKAREIIGPLSAKKSV